VGAAAGAAAGVGGGVAAGARLGAEMGAVAGAAAGAGSGVAAVERVEVATGGGVAAGAGGGGFATGPSTNRIVSWDPGEGGPCCSVGRGDGMGAAPPVNSALPAATEGHM
jgi:hypothetical protein